jgi:hypothetical protein
MTNEVEKSISIPDEETEAVRQDLLHTAEETGVSDEALETIRNSPLIILKRLKEVFDMIYAENRR